MSVVLSLWVLTELDFSAAEAAPIVRILEGMGSALRFLLDHPLEHLKGYGFTTASWTVVRATHDQKRLFVRFGP